MKYISRSKEIVTYRNLSTELDGSTKDLGDTVRKGWVYKRADGTEFVNINEPEEVRREGAEGVPCVERRSKVIDGLT